ncbi:2820_t:CDS:1, partial [Scutellospora calospora]
QIDKIQEGNYEVFRDLDFDNERISEVLEFMLEELEEAILKKKDA